MLDYIVLSPVGNGKRYIIDRFLEHVRRFDPPPKEIVVCLALDHKFDLNQFDGCVIRYSSEIAAQDGSLERICDSREVLRKYFIYHPANYERALWIDTDVLCPPELPRVLAEKMDEKECLIVVNKTMGRTGERLLCGSGVMLTHRHACTASKFWVGNIYIDGKENHLSEDFMFFALFDQGKHSLKRLTGRSGRVCDNYVETNHVIQGTQRKREVEKKEVETRAIPKETKWTFILGCNNSGTSLLHHLLRLHPQIDHISTEGQSHLLTTAGIDTVTKKNHNRVFTEVLEYMNPPRAYDRRNPSVDKIIDPSFLRNRWLKSRKESGGTYLMIKSPPDMVRSLWLQQHFDSPHFIGIVRNGYSTVASIMRSGKSAERAAIHWNLANKIMMRDSEKLKHFHLIKYEDLAENPEKILHELEEFLGLEHFNYSLGDYNVERKYFFPGLREGKIYNKNKTPRRRLEHDKINIIREHAKEMLGHFGYEAPKELIGENRSERRKNRDRTRDEKAVLERKAKR